MNYQETINYLYALLPVFHREGAKAFKPNLDNTIALCAYLGNPQHKFRSIHVAGTNGKGSTSHYMASILQSAGYKTGLYTSPHLKDYTERFRINGISIEKTNIISFVETHQTFIETLRPSFFELSVAIALDFFAHEKVDIAVIEVGLGGRLDSTNIIHPELCMITNIGFDHMDLLGDTLPKIATEKAGIIKSNIPVVISERHEQTADVFIKKAEETGAPIYFAEDCFTVEESNSGSESLKLLVDVYNKDEQPIYRELESQLIGKYQLKNLTGVLEAIEILKRQGLEISNEAVSKGISEVVSLTGLKGRWQVLRKKPLTVCDTGHNEHGLKIILSQIEKLFSNGLVSGQKHFVLGFVKDKNVEDILTMFPKDAQYYFCQADSPRALDAQSLAEIASSIGLYGKAFSDVNQALENVRENASDNDFIYVGGSTFIVAELNEL